MKNILLIITGSISAYKSLELISLLRKNGVSVRCVLTKAGAEFVTPLSLAALTENTVYNDLFSLKDETEMGHIRLSREADLVVVAPASANIIAKMAGGFADDLASAVLLASNKRVLLAPAMNSFMWNNPATQRNIKQLQADGVQIIEPASGVLACGEVGIGKLADVETIFQTILSSLTTYHLPLMTFKAIVTAGATYEAIDPVRFIGNRSSGKQGYAIAQELAREGAEVTLISGVSSLPDIAGVKMVRVTSAVEMLEAVEENLAVDIGVFTAAVADFRPKNIAKNKLKKSDVNSVPEIELVQNPDILATVAKSKNRPKLLIGFAAETENLLENAKSKLVKKGCDFIIANDVSAGKGFDADENQVLLVSKDTHETWKKMSKQEVANKLVDKIIEVMK